MCDDFDGDELPLFSINGEDVADSSRFEPKCWQMCPHEEMIFRERNGLLHKLELSNLHDWDAYRALRRPKGVHNNRRGGSNDNGPSKQFTSKHRAVKQFRRSSAGQNLLHPSDIRPSCVLRDTVDYLLIDLLKEAVTHTLQECAMTKFCYYYDFTFDRLRAIRQDMVVQRLVDDNCFYILEKCIEFYIYSDYIYKRFQNSTSGSELRQLSASFDAHLNRIHLTECLNLLLRYYDYFEQHVWSRSRPIFEALYLMFNLETNHNALRRYQKLKKSALSKDLFNSRLMESSARILLCHQLGNYIKCLRLVAAEYRCNALLSITFYISSLSFTHVRLLQQICIGFRSANTAIPLATLVEWFTPTQSDQFRCLQFVERLANYFQIPLESNQRRDYFSFLDDGDSNNCDMVAKKRLLIKQKFPNLDQWKAPADLHPIGWLPRPANLYRVFFN